MKARMKLDIRFSRVTGDKKLRKFYPKSFLGEKRGRFSGTFGKRNLVDTWLWR